MLKGHRKTYGFSATGFANKVGISLSRYRKIEGDGESTNPLITSLEEIARLGEQFGMEPHELIYYLMNEGAPVPEAPQFKWQKRMLSSLKKVNQKVLSDFTAALDGARKDKIEFSINLLAKLLNQDSKLLLNLEKVLEKTIK